MNPFVVDDARSFFAALMVGMAAGAIVTVILHYAGPSLQRAANKVANIAIAPSQGNSPAAAAA